MTLDTEVRVSNRATSLSSLLTQYMSFVTGAKAIGTAWTIAPSEEEESIWGGKTLTKGNCTLFNKLTIVKLSMTKRVFIMHVFM